MKKVRLIIILSIISLLTQQAFALSSPIICSMMSSDNITSHEKQIQQGERTHFNSKHDHSQQQHDCCDTQSHNMNHDDSSKMSDHKSCLSDCGHCGLSSSFFINPETSQLVASNLSIENSFAKIILPSAFPPSLFKPPIFS